MLLRVMGKKEREEVVAEITAKRSFFQVLFLELYSPCARLPRRTFSPFLLDFIFSQ
jgi:hypothetical protein